MNDEIKVGYCVAYDWYLLKDSISLIYAEADKICLSIDKNRISWSGNPYKFDNTAFYKMIESLDKSNKITIVEESYFVPGLTPMQNEVRQRNMIADNLGKDGWHIQLDCDEFFLDFHNFVKFLQELPENQRHKKNICCAWVVLYKKTTNGFLFVNPVEENKLEFMQIATQDPLYEYSRRNGNFNVYTNFKILHQSWARDGSEVKEKLLNWGHSQDLDIASYFNMWDSLSIDNYHQFRDLHPLVPSLWPRLDFVKGIRISDVVESFQNLFFPALSAKTLFFKNSVFFSRVRKLINWS